jgi:hypothetical protein
MADFADAQTGAVGRHVFPPILKQSARQELRLRVKETAKRQNRSGLAAGNSPDNQ